MARDPEPPDRPGATARPPAQRWRLVVERDVLQADAGAREQQAAWEQALAASGLPMAGLDADRPRPRFAPAAPLGVGVRGEAELVDLWLTERLPLWRVRAGLSGSMPDGHRLVDLYDVWLGAPPLQGQVVASVYRVSFSPGSVDPLALEEACAATLAAPAVPRTRARGDGSVEYDLRPFIDGLEVVTDGPVGPDQASPSAPRLRMVLRHDPEKGVGRPDEVLAELAVRMGTEAPPVAGALVRESLVLAAPTGPASGKGPGGAPRGGQRTGRPRQAAYRPPTGPAVR